MTTVRPASLSAAEPAIPIRVSEPVGDLAAARLDERQHLARDLHDHVLQRLFAAGLAAEQVARDLTPGEGAARLEQVVTDLDDTAHQIRAIVHELQGPLGPDRGSVTSRLGSVAAGLEASLGFAPHVRFCGPVDELPEHLVDDLAAVLREGLANIARHARAGRADVDLLVTRTSVLLWLRDDGIGIGGSTRRSGLDNLRARAERSGGSLRVVSGTDDRTAKAAEGTGLQWAVPRP